MAFAVAYDASVLYPSTLRDLLIRIAQSGLAQAKWTGQAVGAARTRGPRPEGRAVYRTVGSGARPRSRNARRPRSALSADTGPLPPSG